MAATPCASSMPPSLSTSSIVGILVGSVVPILIIIIIFIVWWKKMQAKRTVEPNQDFRMSELEVHSAPDRGPTLSSEEFGVLNYNPQSFQTAKTASANSKSSFCSDPNFSSLESIGQRPTNSMPVHQAYLSDPTVLSLPSYSKRFPPDRQGYMRDTRQCGQARFPLALHSMHSRRPALPVQQSQSKGAWRPGSQNSIEYWPGSWI
jgi:hypothetical protein